MSKCVYFVQTESIPPLFKIGITAGSVTKRIQSLQSGCPYTIKYYAKIKHHNASEIEKQIHSRLDEYRTQGEWFKVPKAKVDNILHEFGVDTTPNFQECILNDGSRCLIRLSDNEIFLGLSALPRYHQIVYFSTVNLLRLDEENELFVNLRELEKDYPEFSGDFLGFRQRILAPTE